MAYYRICPDCGANLDPGEVCRYHKKEPLQCWHTRTAVETLHHDSSTGQKEKQLLSKEEIQ